MRRAVRFLPAAMLLLFVGVALWRLSVPEDRRIESRMVGRPAPSFAAPPLIAGRPGLASVDLADGKPRLVNFFASWCVPCIAEAPVLAELKRQGVPIDGIAVRDREGDASAFLRDHGDPYQRLGADLDSRVQLAWGASGVPESFVVDGRGVVRYQHIGPIEAGDVGEIVDQWRAAR